jgi:hypothetical protein
MISTTIGVCTLALYALTVWAIFRAPVRALQIQRQLDEEREFRQRRLNVFKTLMTYRATFLAQQFVQALNMIEVEFNRPEEKGIRDSWKELLDLYGNWTQETNGPEKAQELTAELLIRMGKSLGYDFDKVYIKKGAYHPMFHVNVEEEQHELRRRLLRLLAGETKLPVAVFEQKFQDIILDSIADTVVEKALAAGDDHK